MAYFDNQYLNDYLEQDRPLKVFVNGQYLDIADESDIQDDVVGYGYTVQGEQVDFHYKDIGKIVSGLHTVTLKNLQSKGEVAPSEEGEDENEDEPTSDKEEDDSPEDVKEESWEKAYGKYREDAILKERKVGSKPSSKKTMVKVIKGEHKGAQGAIKRRDQDLYEVVVFSGGRIGSTIIVERKEIQKVPHG